MTRLGVCLLLGLALPGLAPDEARASSGRTKRLLDGYITAITAAQVTAENCNHANKAPLQVLLDSTREKALAAELISPGGFDKLVASHRAKEEARIGKTCDDDMPGKLGKIEAAQQLLFGSLRKDGLAGPARTEVTNIIDPAIWPAAPK